MLSTDLKSLDYDWSLLVGKVKTIAHKIKRRWIDLLNHRYDEKVYHNFLREHAGFFFIHDPHDQLIILSKLNLGNDFEVDFVRVTDQYSPGLAYELIEMKVPWVFPFTKKGIPSNHLVTAVQQIELRKRWIRENRYQVQKYFPFLARQIGHNQKFSYTIIIGTRKNSNRWLQEINDYSDSLGTSIRSFDFLTEMIEKRWYVGRVNSHLVEHATEDKLISLANPFFKAYTDQQWKNIRTTIMKSHPDSDGIADLLLSQREVNDSFYEFKKKCNRK